MTQAISDNLVTWIDTPKKIDISFIEEVPIVPQKTGQANCIPLKTACEELFNILPPIQWALFKPFTGYSHHLKRLFKRKVTTFSLENATKALDDFHEGEEESEEGEKIYAMLNCLDTLNTLLEEIRLKADSVLRS